MSYLVFARKFRPQNFDEVIGQDHISQTLKNAIAENRIAHAFLFSGPRGCGKTTMARILAKALNCKEGPTANPCGVCESCLAVDKGSSVDVLEIDGASNTGVDDIRELRENVKFAPANSKYKVYIIDEVHMISTSAFNALLKTLEEPPAHVVFILATTEQHKVPVTVLSRCQRYRFKLIPSKEIAQAIKNIAQKENFEIDDEALSVITSASGGSMRDALSLLDQAVSASDGKITGQYLRNLLGLLPIEIIAGVTSDLAKGDMQNILKTVKEITESGYNVLQFARDLRDHLRQVMIYSINPEIYEISNEEKKLFEVQKSLFNVARHVRMNNLLSKALDEMRYNDQPRILLEMYLLKMSEPYYNVGELIERIGELEKTAKSSGGGWAQETYSPKAEAFAMDESAESFDLLSLWSEILAEITEKHYTASECKKAVAKIISPSKIQLSVPDEYHKTGVMEFHSQITKLFQNKTGSNIEVTVVVEKKSKPEPAVETISAVPEESDVKIEYTVEEDLKESSKNAIPKDIEAIAKKLGGKAKKL